MWWGGIVTHEPNSQRQQRRDAVVSEHLIALVIFINSSGGKPGHLFACEQSFNRVPLLSQERVPLLQLQHKETFTLNEKANLKSSEYRWSAFPAQSNLHSQQTPPSESWLSSDFTSHQTTAFFSERVKSGEKEQSVHPSPALSLSVHHFSLQQHDQIRPDVRRGVRWQKERGEGGDSLYSPFDILSSLLLLSDFLQPFHRPLVPSWLNGFHLLNPLPKSPYLFF